MRKVIIASLTLWLCTAVQTHAQTFQECADVTGDGYINVSDMVYHLNMYQGGPDLPSGKGDIDLRAGYTVGDFRYLVGYIFMGYPEGDCPPFASYALTTTNDSLVLPLATIPPGSGSLRLPIIFINHNPVADVLLPVDVIGLNDSLLLDSIAMTSPGPSFPSAITADWSDGASGGLIISYVSGTMPAGTHVLGHLYLHYWNQPGSAISVIPGSPNLKTFANYTYKSGPGNSYSDLTIAMPILVITDHFDLPSLTLEPDTLVFNTVVNGGDPDPQSFDVLSSGAPFNWSLTKTSWLSVDKTSGLSGESVTVSPKTTALTPGTHFATVTVYTDIALGSPASVTVQVNVNFPFPPLDANCDGVFNLIDLIYTVNYLYRGGPPPCNPCDGS